MALSDLIVKAKVNMALVRDPRVEVLDIGVRVEDGNVTLLGDVEDAAECNAAEEIARRIDGVVSVHCELTTGVGKAADTTEMLTQHLLEKLDEAWNDLPDRHALTQADYLRWALWLVYKFHLPASLDKKVRTAQEAMITETALVKIATHVGLPKTMVALEMLRLAETIHASPPTR